MSRGLKWVSRGLMWLSGILAVLLVVVAIAIPNSVQIATALVSLLARTEDRRRQRHIGGPDSRRHFWLFRPAAGVDYRPSIASSGTGIAADRCVVF